MGKVRLWTRSSLGYGHGSPPSPTGSQVNREEEISVHIIKYSPPLPSHLSCLCLYRIASHGRKADIRVNRNAYVQLRPFALMKENSIFRPFPILTTFYFSWKNTFPTEINGVNNYFHLGGVLFVWKPRKLYHSMEAYTPPWRHSGGKYSKTSNLHLTLDRRLSRHLNC